uniref:DUF6788 domain-containing protein n=1 Tax=uncultured bacterium fosmid pJB77G10 TaxID=1478069 RepID=A0A0H3U9U1_9BACT|nr:hypothetical protein [uncultured bacterium fosmid pJB77G10]
MAIIEEVLLEEYNRSVRISKAILKEMSNLPKGSIQIKHINNRDYYYLMFRDGGKVISQYIPDSEVSELSEQIELRRENNKALKEQERIREKIIKALGKGYINEHSAERI